MMLSFTVKDTLCSFGPGHKEIHPFHEEVLLTEVSALAKDLLS